MLLWNKKHFKIGPYGFGALVTIALAVALRVTLISLGWPVTNSDEGTMGLMALHIANHGEHPVFFYGQNYMGALEAYIGAALFQLFGPSLFALRLGLVLLYAFFLVVMYFLARLLYTKKLALVSIILLSFGSTDTFTRQLKSIGGYPETLLFASMILLITSWLALGSTSLRVSRESRVLRGCAPKRGLGCPQILFPKITRKDGEPRRQRFILYGCLGCVIGLGLWSNMLIIPFVVMGMLLLILFCRSELRTWTTFFLLLGFFIGLSPLLIFNVQHPLQNSIAVLWQIHSSGGTSPMQFSFWQALLGTVLISIPMATGANPLCSVSTVPGQWIHRTPCMVFQGSWGLGFILLWTIALFLTIRTLRGNSRRLDSSSSLAEKQHIIRHTARLMLLGSAGLTLLSYGLSPAPALVPATSSRYLVGLLVATPAIISPLWYGISTRRPASTFFTAIAGTLRRGILLLIGMLFVFGTFSTFQQVQNIQRFNQQQYALIDDLLRLHDTHIYSDYWTCDRLIFQSNERIICSVVDEQLQPGLDRYLPYRSIVQNDLNAAYVFTASSSQDSAFAQKTAGSGKRYQRFVSEGYVIYQPEIMKTTG